MTNDSQATNAPATGKNPNGTFAPGNRYATGNPVNRRMSELRRAILDAETPDRVAAVVEKMRVLALAGDTTAANIYIQTCIGKPLQAVELSGPEGEPLGLSLSTVTTVVLEAIKPYGPEARVAVAARLMELSHAGGTGDGPRPGTPDAGAGP